MSSNPVIVNTVRTPIGKAKRGSLVSFRPDDLAGHVMKAVLKKTPQLPKEAIEDIVMGCAMPEGEQGMNVANIAKFIAGIPHSASAYTLNRFCSSGLQSIAVANDAITVGRIEVALAGGVESMSMIPMAGNKLSPNPDLVDNFPQVYLSMGLTAERVAEKYGVSRKDQDLFAFESNMKAARAIKDNRMAAEIAPLEFERQFVDAAGKKQTNKFSLVDDEGPRDDTTLAALAGLKPAFKLGGSVTAGNSSQMSDGAACLALMSESAAAKMNIMPLARLVSFAVAGVPPEIMGIGPVKAIPKALKLAGLQLKDIGLIELNEAFAAQALAVIRELKLDPATVNVNGGAIALGHPLGATGAILTTKLISEMKRREVKYGIVSMCIGGGMGAAGIFEKL